LLAKPVSRSAALGVTAKSPARATPEGVTLEPLAVCVTKTTESEPTMLLVVNGVPLAKVL
jgi:hypothetical protein